MLSLAVMLSVVVPGLAVADNQPCGGGAEGGSCTSALDEPKADGLLQHGEKKSRMRVLQETSESEPEPGSAAQSESGPAKADCAWQLADRGVDLDGNEVDRFYSTSQAECQVKAASAGVIFYAWTGNANNGKCKVLKPSVTNPNLLPGSKNRKLWECKAQTPTPTQAPTPKPTAKAVCPPWGCDVPTPTPTQAPECAWRLAPHRGDDLDGNEVDRYSSTSQAECQIKAVLAGAKIYAWSADYIYCKVAKPFSTGHPHFIQGGGRYKLWECTVAAPTATPTPQEAEPEPTPNPSPTPTPSATPKPAQGCRGRIQGWCDVMCNQQTRSCHKKCSTRCRKGQCSCKAL